jgi:hypothetical protein
MRSANLLILFGIRNGCGRNLLLYLFIKRVLELSVVVTEGCHSYELDTQVYPYFLSRLILYVDDIGIISGGFDVIDQEPVRCRHSMDTGGGGGEPLEHSGAVRQLFIDFKNAFDSVEKYCTLVSLNLVYT